jgi:REP element-mobilizing transposase RayT
LTSTIEAMPRPHRDTGAGIFHIYTHCVWGVPDLYRDDTDRLEFLRELAEVTSRFGLTCISFCLMRSHYHLIIHVEDKILPTAMQRLNHPYAIGFNKRYGLRGHVQFDRYGSRRITDENDLLQTNAYVANNPVEAGLCEKAEHWQWSSHAGTLGLAPAHSFVDASLVLKCFRWPEVDPRAALRDYVDAERGRTRKRRRAA